MVAGDGNEARRVAEEEGFDVAIVDVKLPDVSGVDLIEPLRERARFSEVVLITGFASVDAAIAALRSGAFAFVLKSFRPEELISTVEQALTKVRLKRERDELERRYRDLVDVTDVLVVALDPENRVVLVNRKALDMARATEDVVLGRPFVRLLPEGDRTKIEAALAGVRSQRKERDLAIVVKEVETGMSDIRRRVRWHLSPSRESGGLLYGVGIDVTERHALERRAADAEAISAMSTLALNLAHEIRNPLNAALLQLRLLGRDVDKLDCDAAHKDALKQRGTIVGDEIGRLERLLTEFLELARPRGIARQPVHVGRLVADVLELHAIPAQTHRVTLRTEIAHDGCVAIGDVEKLKQVVVNLVVNALEAMKEGGELVARVQPIADAVVVSVEDTGPGVSPEHLESIFDPFFTTKPAGTGLGLSIVRKIVDQHGGDVRIDSEPGHGTRVHVRIPAGR